MFLLFITGLCFIDAVTSASCGQTSFTSGSGTVKSPNSYGYYANGLNCKYDIKVPFGYQPKLSWSTFDVKGYMPTCYDDYVEIYIGCSLNTKSIGKFCSENSQTPFDVYSPDRCIQLVFKTDSSGGGKGFKAYYESIAQGSSSFFGSGSCLGTHTLYSSSGVIHSYNWPLSDSRSRNCYWKIHVGSYKAIKIAFMDVDLDYDFGCDDDKVKIKGGSSGQSYDSSSTIKASMCGSEKPFSLTSTKDRIWIRFKSNGYYTKRGFVAGYVLYDATKSSSCGQTSFTSGSGTVKSPNSYGYYANGLNCKYDIKVPLGYRPKLSWTTFDVKGYMPSCYDDYIEIYIGCSLNMKSIGKFCSKNNQTPFDVYSPDRCIQLVFKTDSSGGGKGFKAYYESIAQGSSSFFGSGSCFGTQTLYSSSGVIHSFNWPLSDSVSRNCYWKIHVGSYKAIKIAFMDVDLDYDFGCDDDKVKIKGGSSGQSYDSSSTIKASMCGSEKPFSLTSTKDRIWIRFKSNGYYYTKRGFVAGYVLYDTTKKSSSGSSGSPIAGIVVAIVVFAVAAL